MRDLHLRQFVCGLQELHRGLPVTDADAVVAALAPRWSPLAELARARLAAGWIDHCVRRALPFFFSEHGEPDLAEALTALRPIVDEATMLRAEVLLSRLIKLGKPEALLEPVFGLLAHFELLKGELQLEEACFMVVLTSQRVYGDERLVQHVIEPSLPPPASLP